MIQVSVSEDDIREGIAGDCHRCAVSLALTRATGDTEANVYVDDWLHYIEIGGRHVLAPPEVTAFVVQFDRQPRGEDGRIDASHRDYRPPDPFDFELPDQGDPEWKERCYKCEELFDASDLDDEGVCGDCREGDA